MTTNDELRDAFVRLADNVAALEQQCRKLIEQHEKRLTHLEAETTILRRDLDALAARVDDDDE